MDRLCYSIDEAAERLGVSRDTVIREANSEESSFPRFVRMGKRKLIPVKALEQWVENIEVSDDG